MQKQLKIILIAVGAMILLYGVLLGTILAVREPLNHPLASVPIFPIACTTRGCVTSASWLHQHMIALAFNQSTQQPAPTSAQTLTTRIREHLVEHAFLRSPVRPEDITRYREDILHVSSDEDIQKYIPITIAEYDKRVLTPFLQQEALRFQNKVESTNELYRLLTDERPVLLLLFHVRWDTDTGNVVLRD